MNEPPALPAEGQCWLVAGPAEGAWSGKEGQLAAFSGGDWLFLAPRPGMRCWSLETGQWLHYDDGWRAPTGPAAPSGGSIVDTEARSAIETILEELAAAGIFPR